MGTTGKLRQSIALAILLVSLIAGGCGRQYVFQVSPHLYSAVSFASPAPIPTYSPIFESTESQPENTTPSPIPKPSELAKETPAPDIPSPSPSPQKTSQTPSTQSTTYPKRPVIFAPGFMEALPPAFFSGIKGYLEKQGWPNLFYLNNGLVLGSAERYAEKVKQKVEQVLSETGADKVDIIAHSFGGIYTRYYLQNLGGADKVEHFISISSPHHGTQLSYGGFIFKSARQMKPDSDFLTELNAQPLPNDKVCFTTLRSRYDMIVVPYDSAILKGANNHYIGVKDHFRILYSKESYQIIEKTLSKPCNCCRTYG